MNKKLKSIQLILISCLLIIPLQSSLAEGTCDPNKPNGDSLHSNGITHDPDNPNGYPNGLCFPSFNNYTDNDSKNFKDERRFLKTAKPVITDVLKYDKLFTDSLSVKVGDKFTFVAYVHNNASTKNNDNGNGRSVAKNTKTSVDKFSKNGSDYFSSSGTSFTINQYISADNSSPKKINDGTTITSSSGKIKLKYVKNTARMQVVNATNKFPLYYYPTDEIDDFFGSGAHLGSPYEEQSKFWGCEPYISLIFFDVEVIAGEETPPEPWITKGTSTFDPTIPGNFIKYTINFGNKSAKTDITGEVKVTDTLDTTIFDLSSSDNIHYLGMPSGYTHSISGNTITWKSSSSGADSGLDKGETKTIIFEVKTKTNPDPKCEVLNKSILHTTTPKFDIPSNEVENKLYCVNPDITKSVMSPSSGKANPGESIKYKLSFKNTSKIADVMGKIIVEDTVDSTIFETNNLNGIQQTAPTGYQFSVSGNTLKWTYPDQSSSGLPKNTTKEITFTLKVKNPPDPKCKVDNKAKITIDDGKSYEKSDNSNTVNTIINCENLYKCQSMSLTSSKSPVYEGAYSSSNKLYLEITNLNPSALKSLFIWTLPSGVIKVYAVKSNGTEQLLTKSGSNYITSEFKVRIEGTLIKNDKIKVKEQTDTSSASCDKEITVLEKPVEVKCQSITTRAPSPIYAGTYSSDNYLALAVTDLNPDEYKNIAEFTWKATNSNGQLLQNVIFFVNKENEGFNPLTIKSYTVLFKGTLKGGDKITVTEKSSTACAKTWIVETKTLPQCKNLTITNLGQPENNYYKTTSSQEKEILLKMTADSTFKPNLLANPSNAFQACTLNNPTNPFEFCYKYKGNKSEGDILSIFEQGEETPDGACSVLVNLTGGGVDKCDSFSTKTQSINKDTQTSFKITINKDYNYDINLLQTPDDQTKVKFDGCNQNETECNFTYLRGMAEGESIIVKDSNYSSYPKCSINIPITSGGSPDQCNNFSEVNPPPSTGIDETVSSANIDFIVNKTSGYSVSGSNFSWNGNVSFIRCDSLNSLQSRCSFSYNGGMNKTQTITISDKNHQSNCSTSIPITGGGSGSDRCGRLTNLLPIGIDQGSNNVPITFNISKDSGYSLNMKTNQPSNIVSNITCSGTSTYLSCSTTYLRGLTSGQSINIYDGDCNGTIPITTTSGNQCTFNVTDEYGNQLNNLLPNNIQKVHASGQNIAKIIWNITPNNAGGLNQPNTSGLVTDNDEIVNVITYGISGTLKLTTDDPACHKELSIYSSGYECESIKIIPSEPNPIPVTYPDTLTFGVALSPNTLDRNKVKWYLSPQLPGNDVGEISINPYTKEATIQTIDTGKYDNNGNLGYLTVLYDGDPWCFDQRPIKPAKVPTFNDKLKKSTNKKVIDNQILLNSGLDVIRYSITYTIEVTPNPIDSVKFIDTISETGGIILGTYNSDKLVYGGTDIYELTTTDQKITLPACPNTLPCVENSIENSTGVTIRNLPSNAQKITISYNMFAYKENITVNCDENRCGESFNNTVRRIINGFEDKYAYASVYYLCPYLLTRNSGDVFFQNPFDYGVDVSCLNGNERNAGGIIIVPLPPPEETPIPKTGPNDQWWLQTNNLCDNNPAGTTNKIVPRFSSFLCELKTTIEKVWDIAVIQSSLQENKIRSIRNYPQINIADNTIGNLSNTGLESLINGKKIPNSNKKIYYLKGNIKIDSTSEIDEGAKTIIIENGDLIILKNIKYKSSFTDFDNKDQIPSISFIVINGNIYIDPNVKELNGVFFVKKGNTGTGKIMSLGSRDSYEQLTIRGSVFGDIEPLFKTRKFVGDPTQDGGAIVIRHDERILLNIPPGLEEFVDMKWIKAGK